MCDYVGISLNGFQVSVMWDLIQDIVDFFTGDDAPNLPGASGGAASADMDLGPGFSDGSTASLDVQSTTDFVNDRMSTAAEAYHEATQSINTPDATDAGTTANGVASTSGPGLEVDDDHMFTGNPDIPPDLNPSYGGSDIELDDQGEAQVTQPEQRVFESPETGELKPESDTGVGGGGWADTGTTTDDYSDSLGQYPSDPNE
ncbi:hypothetical protein ACIPSH_40825 [Streptomyces iakyrus]|uniref:hypothetical protein n=1 Tax=Streptomyces iakyrus TaxID=68219 RepID=UPI00381CF092